MAKPRSRSLALAAAPSAQPKAKRTTKTGAQQNGGNTVVSGSLSEGAMADIAHHFDQHGTGSGLPGGSCSTYLACPKGNLRTWRRMCENPTVALGLAAAKAPAKAAAWTVVADDDAPAGAEQLISDYVLPLRGAILRDGLRCVEYGWQPFEVVWDLPPKAGGRIVPGKLKPLLPDATDILTDPNTGGFLGLRNTGVELSAVDSLVLSIDGEAGNLRGHSRLENIRAKAWWPWEEALSRLLQYIMKAAGIIPRVQYPKGKSKGPGGVEMNNGQIARNLIASLQRGTGITMPVELTSWGEGLLAKGMDPTKLLAWNIDFLEARNTHGDELKAILDKFEALIIRGVLGPERSVLEGTTGTKAEAGVHGDVSLSISQDLLDQILCILNWHLVDKVLVLNYGPEAAGTVRIEAAPLMDVQRDMLREIIKAILIAPGNIDVMMGMFDLEAAMEQVGLPMLPDAAKSQADPNQPPDKPEPDPGDTPETIAASILNAARAFRQAA